MPDPAARAVTAAALVIGNEILSGRTQDANVAELARQLGAIGVMLREVRMVPDETPAIVAALDALRSAYDHVFTTGGIGPTHDDITSATVARAFGVPVVRHPEAERRLRAHYPPDALNPARLKMAEVPEGAALIDNPISVAPGFTIGNVHVLPGVPSIMAVMLEGLLPTLAGGPVPVVRTITADVPEGALAEPLGTIQARAPTLAIGSYPFFRMGVVGASLVVRGIDPDLVRAAADEIAALVRRLGGTPVVLVGDDDG